MKKWLVLGVLGALAIIPARGENPTEQQAPGVRCDEDRDICPGGRCHSNNDGVEVCIGKASKKPASMSPGDGEGNENSATHVSIKKSSKDVMVSGIDQNDVVVVQANSDGAISGTGGQVDLNADSMVAVTCTPGEDSTPIRVNLKSGTVVFVHPGSSASFNT